MRKIGSNKWLKAGVDFDAGDVVFERAKYLGEDEGQFGVFQVFQDLDTRECYNLGGGHLNWLCQQLEVHDVVKLEYKGEIKLERGKFKGKSSHQYDLWLHEDEENAPVRETSPKVKSRSEAVVDEADDLDDEEVEEAPVRATRKKAAKKKTKRVGKKKTKTVVVEENDVDDLDDLDELE